jgi:AcrR family transcriptional regulator
MIDDTLPNDPRTDRIIEVAMELAEADGYDAVRLRDLAARADVALGTVYRRFSSKEDILAAALERMFSHFREAVTLAPIPGASPEERIGVFIQLATQSLAERPKLAGALLRTIASGVPQVAARVTSYREAVIDVLVTVYRGEATDVPPTESETQLARLVQNAWYAEMVGWTGGLQSADEAVDHTFVAIRWLLRGKEP